MSDYTAYATSAEAGYAFEAGAVELATEVNRLRQSGYRILMDDVYPHEWTSIAFLLEQPPDELLAPGTDLLPRTDSPALIVSWPYADWLPRLDAWPEPVQAQVKAGPLVKGDRDPQPYSMAVLATVTVLGGAPGKAQAAFANGVRLLGHAIEDRGDAWLLRTLWQADRPVAGDVTLFVHLLDGGTQIGTADGDAGDGLYPMRLWRPGDVIVDERLIQLTAEREQLSIAVGLYDRQSGERVRVVESVGPVSGDALRLGAPGGPGP